MWLDDLFEAFHNRIALNPDRISRAQSAYSNLESFLKDDAPLSAAFVDLFKQGSLAINTATRPLEERQEFDLDTVFILDASKVPGDPGSPHELIAWIARRLREHEDYIGKVTERKRCVRITYAGEFHVDVVPARLTGGILDPLQIPSKKEGWRLSHPRGYVNWALSIDTATNKRFSRVTTILKFWRDFRFGLESRPKSILLTTLVGTYIPREGNSTAEALVVAMESLSRFLDEQLFVPFVANPALPNENLARDWTAEQCDLFGDRLRAAASKARKALMLAGTDRERSIQEWIGLFGEKFPRLTSDDGKRLAEASRTGSLFVTAGGGLEDVQPPKGVSTPVPPHRFYGASSAEKH